MVNNDVDAEMAREVEQRKRGKPVVVTSSSFMRVFFVVAITTLIGTFIYSLYRYYWPLAAPDPVAIAQEIMDKPKGDSRTYMVTTFANGLEVLAVEDQNSLSSALAVSVQSGSFDDPEDFPGLAHFLEHMLFLGTKKYPDPNAWDEFISRHGGKSNAFTASEATVFYTTFSSEAASEAMDRFADFFRAPLFKEEWMDREVLAVTSEHQKNIQDPARRNDAVLTSLADPASPVGVFHTGDVESLKTLPEKQGKNPLKALQQQFARHFCTARMRVVLFGPQAAKDQLKMAKTTFGEIPETPVGDGEQSSSSCSSTQTSHAVPKAWPPERLGKWVDIQGTSPKSTLQLSFSLPDLQQEYKSRPLDYIQHMLTYQGKESLFYTLRDVLGLIDDLSVDVQMDSSGSTFMLTLFLAQAGATQPDVVLSVTFLYLALLRRSGADSKVEASLHQAWELKWHFGEKKDPFDSVQDLGEKLTRLPVKDVLWGDDIAKQSNPDLTNRMIRQLVPSQANIAFIDPSKLGEPRGSVPVLKKSEISNLAHYGVSYAVRPMAEVWKNQPKQWEEWGDKKHDEESLRKDLEKILANAGFKGDQAKAFPSLPKPLTDVPQITDIQLKDAAAEVSAEDPFGESPVRLMGEAVRPLVKFGKPTDLWYRRGWRSNAPNYSPQVSIKLLFRPLVRPDQPERTPLEAVRARLYEDLLVEQLDTSLADLGAKNMGLDIEFAVGSFEITLTGVKAALKDNSGKVFKELAAAMESGSFESRFNRVRDDLQQQLADRSRGMPITYAIEDRSLLITKGAYSDKEMLDSLSKVDKGQVAKAAKDLLFSQPVQLTAQVIGNSPKEEAVAVVKDASEALRHLSASASIAPDESLRVDLLPPIVQLAKPIELRKLNPRVNDQNDVTVVSTIVGPSSVESRVLLGLLGRILQRISFDELRTKQQLGYVANGGHVVLSNVDLLSIVVQGTVKNADEMEASIEKVIYEEMPKVLRALTSEELADHKAALKAALSETPFLMKGEVEHFWAVAKLNNADCFHLTAAMKAYMDNGIDKEHLLKEWQRIFNVPGGRKKVIVKYFSRPEHVGNRPTADVMANFLKAQGLTDDALLKQLRTEHDSTFLVQEASSMTRATIVKEAATPAGYFPTNLVCTAGKPGAAGAEKASAATIEGKEKQQTQQQQQQKQPTQPEATAKKASLLQQQQQPQRASIRRARLAQTDSESRSLERQSQSSHQDQQTNGQSKSQSQQDQQSYSHNHNSHKSRSRSDQEQQQMRSVLKH
mmetsp:Transcript_11745/g.25855  ORF Transcript_11745/g.25855 Transcript_11745/m.25855 type:complete len:1265 (-) Transcript_11745:355-4149(-)